MWLESVRLAARYNQWANERLYVAVARLGDEERRRKRPIFGDCIDGVLHHLFIADGLAMATLTRDLLGFRPKDRLGAEILIESMVQCLYPVMTELTTARQHLDRQIVEYVDTLTEAELLEPLSYFDLNGERHKLLTWQLLADLGVHQVHHRGQLSSVMHELGQGIGNLDLSHYLDQSCKSAAMLSGAPRKLEPAT